MKCPICKSELKHENGFRWICMSELCSVRVRGKNTFCHPVFSLTRLPMDAITSSVENKELEAGKK